MKQNVQQQRSVKSELRTITCCKLAAVQITAQNRIIKRCKNEIQNRASTCIKISLFINMVNFGSIWYHICTDIFKSVYEKHLFRSCNYITDFQINIHNPSQKYKEIHFLMRDQALQ